MLGYLPPDTSAHCTVHTPRQPDRPVLGLSTTEGWKAELIWVTGYIPRWFTRPQTVNHPSTNPAAHARELNSRPVDHKSNALTTTPPSHLTIREIQTYNRATSFSVNNNYNNNYNKLLCKLLTLCRQRVVKDATKALNNDQK